MALLMGKWAALYVSRYDAYPETFAVLPWAGVFLKYQGVS